ncbi:MAG: hypothetical protein U0Y10_10185 [Spirosomataceae bacterium]
MSNFSNIGFNFQTIEELYENLDKMIPLGKANKCTKGTYLEYAENSGVAIYLQFNKRKEFIGFNPHFNGYSKRNVCITNEIENGRSILDGCLHAWAEPTEKGNPNSGQYPFVFAVPDLQRYEPLTFPMDCQIQLSAFTQGEISIFDNEQEFRDSQTTQFKFATKSFVPLGLFVMQTATGEEPSSGLPQPFGLLSGVVKEWANLPNMFTGDSFCWMLVETAGGEIDIVCDPALVSKPPKVGSIVQGDFWLTARLLNVQPSPKKRGLLAQLFNF